VVGHRSGSILLHDLDLGLGGDVRVVGLLSVTGVLDVIPMPVTVATSVCADRHHTSRCAVQVNDAPTLNGPAAHVVPVAGPPSFEKSQVNAVRWLFRGHGVGDDDVGQVFGAVVLIVNTSPENRSTQSDQPRSRSCRHRSGSIFFTIWIWAWGDGRVVGVCCR